MLSVLKRNGKVLKSNSGFYSREYIPPTIRFYGDLAPWNISINQLKNQYGDISHPSSSNMITHLLEHTNIPKQIQTQKSYAIYYSSDADTTIEVSMSAQGISWGSNLSGSIIPWNSSWRPAPTDIDGQLILFDEVENAEYNFFEASYTGVEDKLYAINGNLIANPDDISEVYDYNTYTGSFRRSRGSGIQYGAMAVRKEEIQNEIIRHALSMRITFPSSEGYVQPASKLERTEEEITTLLGYERDLTLPPAIKHGNRFYLDITDNEIDVWASSLTQVNQRKAKIIAKSLRDYGWFVTDTQFLERNAGGHVFDFESDESAGDYWNSIGFYGLEFRDMLQDLFTTSSIKPVNEITYY